MLNPALEPFDQYTFARLNATLGTEPPVSNEPPILLSIGEPQLPVPDLGTDVLAEHAGLWNRYPPPAGDIAFRTAVVNWLTRRFALAPGSLDPERHVIPTSGTRAPLYQMGFVCTPPQKNGQRPAVLIPNPFYHVYQGAAIAGGAEPIYLPTPIEHNHLPDLDALDDGLLARTSVFYLCTPANPQGTQAGPDYLRRALRLARQHDFVLALDECYCEIYRGEPPFGGLQTEGAFDGDLANLVSFHSLSKRSNAPGFRSGFLVGDPAIIRRYQQFVTFGGVPLPLPILHASTALWNDDDHVAGNRAHYARNFEIAEEVLAPRTDVFIPPSGFFLWLDVGDGMKAARRLWRETAVKTVPGALMAREDADGRNPGLPYLRIALVNDAETTRAGLTRLADMLFGK